MGEKLNTGINDKHGNPITEGDTLKMIYETMEMIGVAKQDKKGKWLIYKDDGNYLGLDRLQGFIEITD